jgi:hypothetical protein
VFAQRVGDWLLTVTLCHHYLGFDKSLCEHRTSDGHEVTLPKTAERQSNYLFDLTEAHTGVGNCRKAVRMLGRAEQIAPEEVRCRPLAHGLLRSLLN